MLPDLSLAGGYSTGRSDLVRDFYIPCLDEASRYDRAVGFFRSSLFILVGVSFSSFVRRGGRIRLVCSPHLSAEDAEAVTKGLALRAVVDPRLTDDIDSMLEDPADRAVAEFLASLVAVGAMEIRLAVRPESTGIFHDKVGIFEDSSGNKLSFVGSANETYSAWDPNANHEGFEVFCSWGADSDAERVRRHCDYFSHLWNGQEPGVSVLDFPEAARAKLITLTNPDGLDAAAARLRGVVLSGVRHQVSGQVSGKKTLQEHQRLAVQNWFGAGNRGILTHATGSGKTITAIDILRRWLAGGNAAIVFVPTQVLAAQWRREIQTELGDQDLGVLEVGAGFGRSTWEASVADYTRPLPDLGPRVVIATMASGSTAAFLDRVRGGQHLLVVADEVHRIGSPQQRSILGIDAGGRLGLSATPERYGDPDGTARILAYFGPILQPEFTLGDAIHAGRLVPYDYFVHEVGLTAEEAEAWDAMSEKIRLEYAKLPEEGSGAKRYSEHYKLLLIQRARIVKQACNKTTVALEILTREYKQDDRWLVYCDDQAQLHSVANAARAVGLPTLEYHSAMEGARAETLELFARSGGVLVAIKCLDEGVDLPSVNRALIAASSSNPREFIQRRGRVLRAKPGKFSAAIHDLLVVPMSGEVEGSATVRGSIVRTELGRARQFAAFCRNTATRIKLDMIAASVGLAPFADTANDYEDDGSVDVGA